MQQAGTRQRHLALKLGLEVFGVDVEDELVNWIATSINGILDWPHPLLRLRHALEVEVGAVLAEHLKNLEVARSDGEEDAAEAFVDALLINVDLLLPLNGNVCLAFQGIHLVFLFLLLVVFGAWLDVHGSSIFDKLLRLLEQEVNDANVAAHDCNVQTACSLGVAFVVDADAFEQLDHGEVSVVHRVVQAVESLRVSLVN